MDGIHEALAWMWLDIYSASILALIMLAAFACCVAAIWKEFHD